MHKHPFLCGIGLGMAAGAAVSMVAMPQKRQVKCAAKRAARAMEDMAETLAKTMSC